MAACGERLLTVRKPLLFTRALRDAALRRPPTRRVGLRNSLVAACLSVYLRKPLFVLFECVKTCSNVMWSLG